MSTCEKLTSSQIGLLEQYLGRGACNEALGRRAAEYALFGGDESVLGDIRRSLNIARWMPARSGPPNPDYQAVHELLASLVDLCDPRMLVRLAKVYRAQDEGIHMPGNGSPIWAEAPWLDSWLNHLRNHLLYPWGRQVITCTHLVAMLESEGHTGEFLVRPAIQMIRGARTFEDLHARMAVEGLVRLPDYGRLLEQYASVIRRFLKAAAAPDRVPVLELLHQAKCDPEPFLPDLVEYATGGAKTVRDAAETLLAGIKDAVRPELERIASQGEGGPRGQAFELMASFYGPDARAFLRQFEGSDLPKAARIGLERALERVADAVPPEGVVPAEAHVRTEVPLSPAAREAFRGIVAAHNRALAELRTKRGRLASVPDLQEADIQERIHLLETLVNPKPQPSGVFRLNLQLMQDAANAFVDAPGVELIHVVRLLILTGDLHATLHLGGYFPFMPAAGEILDRFRRRQRFGLLELAAVLRAVGIDDRSIAFSMVERTGVFLHWPSDLVAPYLLQNIPVLESLLRVKPSPAWWYSDEGVFRMLEHLPEVPQQLLPRLWNLATGEADGERALAKGVLSKLPDLDDRLIRALRDGQAHIRANAAHWLADRRCRAAAPAVLKAFHKEKQEATKDALLVALERFGTPVEELLDRKRLLAECQAAAAKGIPPSLAWFPLAKWPAVHWEDSGEPVDPVILTGLLIRAHKLATPKPGPLLRRYCALWRREERPALGQFILDAWIAHDIGESVPGGRVLTMPSPQPAPQPAPQAPLQPGLLLKLAAMALTQSYTASTPNPSTSAIKEKGILAVAAACCAEAAVATIADYLKRWYGYRAAQCRALLGILPWIDSPAATQLLLAIARRFRTASIREEAETLCLELAAWKGWSMDQLGDRTIPTAGFDEGPDQEVNLGGRTLILTLTPQLTVQVSDAEDKALKDFPAAAKNDDPALYEQARQSFTEAKKSLRNTAKQQTERLYEAMCAERVWPFAELKELLFNHPIAGRLCQRLIWEAMTTPPVTFRPLDDQTLTSARDEQVEVRSETKVRIAYGPEGSGEWLRHLADYEVAPLFPQLDRPLHQPSGPDADALHAFEGHSVSFFALRNLVTKFGYQRGEMVDGPFFSTYVKRLAGLSLDVELEFSGMDMPGENKPVVLTETRFRRGGEQLPLSQVPRVLLSECWHDLRAIAAAGTGYDPDWKDKVPF